jgi:hypothetical protein
MDAFGYKFQSEFDIFFNDEKTDVARCIALEPPEKVSVEMPFIKSVNLFVKGDCTFEYHMAPEIFVSEGSEGSIVGNWVKARGGIGGIHHIAYQVESVQKTMDEWKEKGYAEFTSDKPMTCPGLTQVFTKPSELTGVIYEFIERSEHGFCKENVRQLMESTKSL